MRVAVDEAGDDAPPARVDALVAVGTLALDGDDLAVLDHQGGVADDSQLSLAQLGRVRHQEADVVDDQRAQAHTSAIACSSSTATSSWACRPSLTISRPP